MKQGLERCVCGKLPKLICKFHEFNERMSIYYAGAYSCKKCLVSFGDNELIYPNKKGTFCGKENDEELIARWNKGIRKIKKITGHEKD